MSTQEQQRLADAAAGWKRWGPYLSERAWGTIREDYSHDGEAWDYFPHDHARSRAYRWNEDGLAGISDDRQYLCLSLALWNGRDDMLKERLFGVSGPEGNHGEDVKEYYFYEDSTPTHSYMRMHYKYPHAAYPYDRLVAESRQRGVNDPEFELLDTGIFDENRNFDVTVEYAKAGTDDILMQVSVTNCGPEPETCWVLPTLWFRNTWSWGYPSGPMGEVSQKPRLRLDGNAVQTDHPAIGTHHLYALDPDAWLFTENETNHERLYDTASESQFTKDAFHRNLILDDADAVNQAGEGTKTAAMTRLTLGPGEQRTVKMRLSSDTIASPFADFDDTMRQRQAEADDYFDAIQAPDLNDELRMVQRQAYAGMLWSKQVYYYDVEQWMAGDPGGPPPPEHRRKGRNRGWEHLNNFDIISMPDKWEYPWYAAWDLAFHCIPLARLDPEFAKGQLQLITREWYMHANGQLPAYEWALGDVNPPVHAWAVRRVYEIAAEVTGDPDTAFLRRMFHKLLLNFTSWVNRKDPDGNNIFQGGFLGMDNISVFDRSVDLPGGGHIDQSDGTAWMAFYTLEMLAIAMELSKTDEVYQDMATKFFEHFLSIATAMTADGHRLWDDDDGFFYDVFRLPDGTGTPLQLRSMVGLIPLLAVAVIDRDGVDAMPDFADRMHWFLRNRPHLSKNITSLDDHATGHRHLISILDGDSLTKVLGYMLDEDEFLSPHGIRSLSKAYQDQPYRIEVDGQNHEIAYQPAESASGVFGGNSNWRGPIWFPINFLLIEALQDYHGYFADDLRVEYPSGSGNMTTLDLVAKDLSQRLIDVFLRDDHGSRPVFGSDGRFFEEPAWRDRLLFYEYFHGDTGAGLGASHQTGWTGLVAELIEQATQRTPVS
ncbi:MAG: glucosidase [Acidimicrobiia bacterium]|nr:glucosidase [Acidimicrobiia bacterium]MDX2468534.1 glucosidase [Acidimicrobiia bacterium]